MQKIMPVLQGRAIFQEFVLTKETEVSNEKTFVSAADFAASAESHKMNASRPQRRP